MALPAISSRKPLLKATWTMEQAHERTGHTYPEALEHLPEACSDIAKVKGEHDPYCQICKEYDAKKLISRRVPMRAHRPFYRLCWDVIPMRDGYEVHLYDDFLGYHFVERTYSTQARELVKAIRKCVNTCKRRWKFDVIVIRLDGQPSLLESDEWHDYLADTGLTIEVSAPDVHEQNGAAEKSGAVLTLRAGKLKSSGNLPDSMWPECYEAAAYILNRMATRRLKWQSPLGKLQELTGVPVPEPKLAHLRAFGSRAYALNYHLDQLDRLEPRVHIGYLVGYESTNIFRIWIPHLSRIISARDVTFDESKRYQPSDTFDLVTEERVQPLEITSLEIEDEANIELPIRTPDLGTDAPLPERSIDAPNDTIIVDSGTGTDHGINTQLLSPEITPEPEPRPPRAREPSPPHSTSNESDTAGGMDKSGGKGIPTTGMSKGMDEDLILPTNRRGRLREAHAATLATLHYDSAYHVAFATGITHQQRRLHRTELPAEPSNWQEMLKHNHRAGFLAAVKLEYGILQENGAFIAVPEAEAKDFVIPTRWVFTYKFDEEGHLIKYKARLVVRGDLQPKQDEETYAATLAARVFRFLMAVAAHFNLEAK